MLQVLAVGFHLGLGDLGRAEAALVGLVELGNAHAQLALDELFAVADQLALVQIDLKAVGAGRVGGGGHEHAGRAVGILDVRGHVVLNLDVVPLALLAERAHLGGHAADPLPQVEVVRALVQQNAAAFAFPRRAPRAGIVVALGAEPVGDDPVGAADRAHFTAGNDFLHLAVHAVGALVEHDGECLVGLRRHLVHLPHGLGIHARGLLADHVQIVRQRGNHQRRMQIVGRGHQHRVHQSALHQLLRVVKARHAGQVLLRPQKPRRVDVRHRRQRHLRHIARHQAERVARAHVAHADDAQSHLFHRISSFVFRLPPPPGARHHFAQRHSRFCATSISRSAPAAASNASLASE